MLSGKKVILAVTGSIAAYKSALITRLLIKAGADVRVILTPSARDFVTPLTLATLSKNPVLYEFVEDKDSGEWNNHVEMGLWADLMLVAPCSANTMAKMAHGECDNLVMAVYLSAKCPVYVAPAMDLDMYKHATTQQNLATLESNGNRIIPVGTGELASGLEGEGRMAEPEEIIEFLEEELGKGLPLSGKKVMITAGPTYEPIDPVRFIGNRSSGKMGYAIAAQALEMGARVKLIAGPNDLTPPEGAIDVQLVTTADEMLEQCLANYDDMDIVIMAAAVADYTPVKVADQKIKKKEDELNVELKRTEDIIKQLGAAKKHQFLVGFALETENEIQNAESKLKKKNMDMIVLNSLQDAGAGFGHDTNKVTIIDSNNNLTSFELKSKKEVATDILHKIIELGK